jgi:glycerol-3-phosphate cytidylyltransferase
LGAIVYTGGTFDLFHAGHVRFLKQCKRIAGQDGKVVVALNRDSFIEDYKGKAPIVSFAERAEVLQACKFVDEVIPNYGNADSKIAIDKVKPDFVVIGDDWARKDYYAQMQFSQDWLDKRNIGLIYVPYTEGISTTALKSRIAGKRLN